MPQTEKQRAAFEKMTAARDRKNAERAAARGDAPPAEKPPRDIRPLPEPKSMRNQIGFALNAYNGLLLMVPPLREQALDMVELELLSEGLDDAQKANATVRRYI